MLAAVLAALIEIQIAGLLNIFAGNYLSIVPFAIFIFLVYQFLLVALVEELSKYLIVKEKVVNDPEFDEPVDTMLYMIIIALGFAALENILYLLPTRKLLFFSEILRMTVAISFLRFIGATFLHALCSGTLGYFLALSFFETKKRSKLILKGVIMATVLHALYNISIIGVETSYKLKNYIIFSVALVSVAAILIGLAVFVLFGFRKLKKIASVCKLH